ncbi:putative G-patch domain protein [Aspergillus undulatus]|uniref:putative G-patch domain protein n=1 Tax=Aspergillus undulatus TaxID=1810928 RepID=UPI003CCD27AF
MASKRTRAAFEADFQAHQSPYAFFGTPLPPLDEGTRDDGSYVPVWKQEVTDDRGRKRLHGAFTGGFSAGYFNTVGSKEGWTPATFVSSRQNRAKDARKQRAEDFMDEEDIREAEEARTLQTNDEFSGFGSTATDTTRVGGLMDVFKVSGETVGVKLLKKMGWREGQGIGPKVRRKAAGDDADNMYLFAPENPPMVAFVRKTDHKGLGFEGEARLSSRQEEHGESDEDTDPFFGRRLITDKSKQPKHQKPRQGAFGVGVLNDTGSDDEDPYSMGPKISYNRTIGGDRKKKGKMKTAETTLGSSNPLLSNKPVFIPKKAIVAKGAAGFRKCHDGRLPLDGFLLAEGVSSLTLSLDKKYAPPEIPNDWKSKKAPSNQQKASGYASTAEAARASTLDPVSRAALLGEDQLPAKSIFDWMTPEGREKIAKLTGKTNLPPALGEKAPQGYELSESQKRKDLWDLVPKVDKLVAVQALTRAASGWMPYSEDEEKRTRYRTFLEICAGLRDSLPDRVPGSSTDKWTNELNEFARAAEVFKPVSGVMASRFTSASAGPKGSSGEAEPNSNTALLSKPSDKPEDPAIAAAKIGMFGPMTRTTISFYPTRLLCKRFNVKLPSHAAVDPGEPGGGSSSSSSTNRFHSAGHQTDNRPRELVSQDVLNQLMLEAGGAAALAPSCGDSGTASPMHAAPGQTIAKQEPMVVEADHNEALEGERPGEAVFKAIFGSDDEDEEE